MRRRGILLAMGLPSIILGADFALGENLLTPYEPSMFEGDTQYVKEEHGYTSNLWQSDERGFADHYVVNIVQVPRDDVGAFRGSQDKPGRSSCDSFSSETLDSDNRNGYSAEMWKTKCEVREIAITTIQLAIAGNDNLYHLRKLWKVPITDGEVSEWVKMFENVSVCDTRTEEHPCPPGFQPVQ